MSDTPDPACARPLAIHLPSVAGDEHRFVLTPRRSSTGARWVWSRWGREILSACDLAYGPAGRASCARYESFSGASVLECWGATPEAALSDLRKRLGDARISADDLLGEFV